MEENKVCAFQAKSPAKIWHNNALESNAKKVAIELSLFQKCIVVFEIRIFFIGFIIDD